MAHEPTWGRPAVSRDRPKAPALPIACMLFVTAMGAAFWIGAVWASQTWYAFSR